MGIFCKSFISTAFLLDFICVSPNFVHADSCKFSLLSIFVSDVGSECRFKLIFKVETYITIERSSGSGVSISKYGRLMQMYTNVHSEATLKNVHKNI